LSQLKQLPIDTLKIDQSFVRDIPNDTNDMAISAAVVAMAGELGLKTIAEGVETIAQANFLRDHGCEMAQGFLYSRPVPASEAEQFLKNSADTRPGTVQ
jgi:EAL domain-containing protein (putative c-di-GMP-specific phosphodiesterase class I)